MDASSQSTLRGYYARRAAEYEDIYKRPERQDDLRAIEARLSKAFANDTVLEIACGTGYWTQFIARSAAAIIAVDCNREVIEIAKQKDYGSCKVKFLLADVYSLAEVSGDFNAGFGGFWWSHVPKAQLTAFLIAFHSKLAEDAKVLFLDNHYVEGSNTPISRRDADGNTYQLRKLADGSEHEVLKDFPSDEDLSNALSPFSASLSLSRLMYYWLAEYRVSRRR